MATQNLGRVGIVLKGTWGEQIEYTKLDLVSYDGNSWVAKKTSTGVEPTTENSEFWQLISNNSDLIATVQGYKEDAEAAATAAEADSVLGAQAQAAIAPTFSASTSYIAGQIVWYSGTLYKFTADHAAGAWTGTDATTDILGNDVSDLKSAIDSVEEEIDNFPMIKESDAENVDLDISDPNGNVILRLADGHIQTKNFDSSDFAAVQEDVEDIQSAVDATPLIKNSSATGVDLDVSDNAGNVIMRLQGGHIKSKNFDSSALADEISGMQEDITEIEEAIAPITPVTVTVDSVADLLDEIANGTSDIIMIENGTYAVLNIEVTRNVQIVGESRTGVILTCDGTTDHVNPVTDRHGIRFQKGGALKNLTFNVHDVKYTMHQDNIAVGYDLLIENCTFNRYDDSCGYYFFIGCGCYGTQNITVKNCSFIFSENTHDRVSYGIFWHNWHLAKSQLNALAANVTMKNCGCVGCGIIIVTDLASKDVNDVISVLNCCSTESAPISSGANGYYIDVPNSDVPYNVLFIINCKIGNMILVDRTAVHYAYLGAVITNFTM